MYAGKPYHRVLVISVIAVTIGMSGWLVLVLLAPATTGYRIHLVRLHIADPQ